MTDIKDLREKTQEFMKLSKKITQGDWDIDFQNERGDFGYTEDSGEITISYEPTVNKYDFKAIKSIHDLFAHIEALQQVIDEYDARIEKLKKYHNMAQEEFDNNDHTWADIARLSTFEKALEIMVDEGKTND